MTSDKSGAAFPTNDFQCPLCKSQNVKYVVLVTDWGYEHFLECESCGILFRGKGAQDA